MRLAGELLPNERVASCSRYIRRDRWEPGFGARVMTTPGGPRWSDLTVCNSVWMCPVCSANISEQRRRELTAAVDRWRELGGRFALVTYTVRHHRRDGVKSLLERIRQARARMCRTREYRQLLESVQREHAVSALEVTVGTDTGWHPHLHDMWFQAPGSWLMNEYNAVRLQALLAPLWQRSCRAEGLDADLQHGVDVRVGYGDVAEYVAKYGRDPDGWDLPTEITKGRFKRGKREGRYTPFGLLRAISQGEDHHGLYAGWFQEYAAAFKGRHQLQWTAGSCRALTGADPLSDAEASEAMPESEEVLRTFDAEWDAVRRSNAQGLVLDTFDRGGRAAVVQLLGVLVERWCDRSRLEAVWDRWRYKQTTWLTEPAKVPAWVYEPSELPEVDIGEQDWPF